MSPDSVDRLNAALEGRYRLERKLGEGGMATVYLADDLRHERKVALKVLKPELAAVVGAERFLAEIRTTANLQHPHILPLFDSGETGGSLFYVMPFVEGESLRERLDREHQLPVDEAVRIARNVAEALDYAHRGGVIHRDIKPANILLQDGTPVISDFGIALAVARTGGGARLTETGLSLGTPHYMSPEQATGDQHVGPPTDIYALGCVLHEMLVGDPPHTGSTPQAVLASIITGRAQAASELRPSVPANVDAAVRKALEKLSADRFSRARDLAGALADPGFRHGFEREHVTQAPYPAATVAALAATIAVLAVTALWGWLRGSPEPTPAPVVRLTAALPDEHRLALGVVGDARALPLAVSRDGGTLAYVGESRAGTRLYVRELDSFQATALDGTEGARQPFFSPDGEWIGYFATGRLFRVRTSGGAPVPVAAVDEVPWGGAWGPDDRIVFSTQLNLWQVGIEGGEPERIELSSNRVGSAPSFLPASAGSSETPLVLVSIDRELHVVSLPDGDPRPLRVGGTDQAFYLPGFIVYAENTGIVRAVPFDLASLEVTGASISVLDNVFRPNQTSPTLAVSPSGTLVYVEGASERRLMLVDRAGRATALPFPAGDYRFPHVSPDGRRLTVSLRTGGLHVFDIESGRGYPVEGGLIGVWSPAGDEFATIRGGRMSRVSAAPGSQLVPITEETFLGYVSHWGDDGLLLLFTADPRQESGFDIYVTEVDGSAPVRPFLITEANEWRPVRSPNGRWLAYMSDLSGRDEVYVREFPVGEPRQVSVNGGAFPLFSRSGDELFYLNGEQVFAVMTNRLERTGSLEPELLFTGNYVILGPSWDVRPQGDFVMMSAGRNFLREIQVVRNWVQELAELFEARP